MNEVRVKGARELEAAFLELRREVLTELKPVIVQAAEVVRVDAQQRAGADISNIGPRWERMRVGVTVKNVYVAPKSHNRGGSPRPNLAGLLMEKAMEPALDAHVNEVVAKIDTLVNVSAARQGF